MDHRLQAQTLRTRLNDHGANIVQMASEAALLFHAAGSIVHVRWLDFELKGYGAAVDHAPLHEVLGVPAGDRLAVHVSAYRAQAGRIIEPQQRYNQPFRHFFIESLPDLSSAAERMRGSTAVELHLSFGPGVVNYPAAGAFPAGVFDAILLGFRAVLHLQLGSLAQ
jgi:hypothetical protein